MNTAFIQQLEAITPRLQHRWGQGRPAEWAQQYTAALEQAEQLMETPRAAREENVKALIEYCRIRGDFQLLALLAQKASNLTPKTAGLLQDQAATILQEEVLEGPEWAIDKSRARDGGHILQQVEPITGGGPDKLLDALFDKIAASAVLARSQEDQQIGRSSSEAWRAVIIHLSEKIDRRLARLLERWDLSKRKFWELANLRGAGPHTYQKLVQHYRTHTKEQPGRLVVANQLASRPICHTLPEVNAWLYQQNQPLVVENLLLNAPTAEKFQKAFQHLMELLGEEGRETLLMVEGPQKEFLKPQQLRPLLNSPDPNVRYKCLQQLGQIQ